MTDQEEVTRVVKFSDRLQELETKHSLAIVQYECDYNVELPEDCFHKRLLVNIRRALAGVTEKLRKVHPTLLEEACHVQTT